MQDQALHCYLLELIKQLRKFAIGTMLNIKTLQMVDNFSVISERTNNLDLGSELYTLIKTL